VLVKGYFVFRLICVSVLQCFWEWSAVLICCICRTGVDSQEIVVKERRVELCGSMKELVSEQSARCENSWGSADRRHHEDKKVLPSPSQTQTPVQLKKYKYGIRRFVSTLLFIFSCYNPSNEIEPSAHIFQSMIGAQIIKGMLRFSAL